MRTKIESTKLHGYENNVDAMLADIQDTYQRICHMSLVLARISITLSRPPKVTLTLALVLMLTLLFFVAAARNKYLNVVAPKEYNKVDLQKQELLTLTTKIEGLEAQLRQNTALATSSGGGGGTNAASGLDRSKIAGTSVERWRVTKQGVSSIVDGKTYWWCKKHIEPAGRWNGMYVTHKPGDHDAVRETSRKSWRQRW